MRSYLRAIFGAYAPLVNSNGEIIEGLSGIDFEYICGVIIFTVVLIYVLKAFVGVIHKK